MFISIIVNIPQLHQTKKSVGKIKKDISLHGDQLSLVIRKQNHELTEILHSIKTNEESQISTDKEWKPQFRILQEELAKVAKVSLQNEKDMKDSQRKIRDLNLRKEEMQKGFEILKEDHQKNKKEIQEIKTRTEETFEVTQQLSSRMTELEEKITNFMKDHKESLKRKAKELFAEEKRLEAERLEAERLKKDRKFVTRFT